MDVEQHEENIGGFEISTFDGHRASVDKKSSLETQELEFVDLPEKCK